MGFTVKPLHEEHGALLVRLDRRLRVQERSPSGAKTLGPQSLAVIPAVRVQKSANATIATNTLTTLSWDVEVRDTAGMHDNAVTPSRMTAPIAGLYLFEAAIEWDVIAAGNRQVAALVNGTSTSIVRGPASTGGAEFTIQVLTCTLQFAAGGFAEVSVWQTSGGNLTILATSLTYAALTWLGNV